MTNEVIREILHKEETLVDKINNKRLTWFGRVTRMNEKQLPSRAMHLRNHNHQGRASAMLQSAIFMRHFCVFIYPFDRP